MRSVLPVLAATLGIVPIARSDEVRSARHEWTAGAYSFSDELGGFTIWSVSGIGTRADPVVIRQTLHSASPVTIVIRAVGPLQPFGRPGLSANGFISLHLETRNGSGQAWLEFEFELQERFGVPSTFGDGLSFDQRRTENASVGSSAFRRYSLDFEPYDRLLFSKGKVDPAKAVGFDFLITDFTPRATFYLVQDPRIPFS